MKRRIPREYSTGKRVEALSFFSVDTIPTLLALFRRFPSTSFEILFLKKVTKEFKISSYLCLEVIWGGEKEAYCSASFRREAAIDVFMGSLYLRNSSGRRESRFPIFPQASMR